MLLLLFYQQKFWSISLGFKQEKGQGLVEYALIILLIALAVIGSLVIFGQGVDGLYSDIVSELSGITP